MKQFQWTKLSSQIILSTLLFLSSKLPCARQTVI